MPTITDQLGRVLQRRYRLEASLGTGASAQVYLAYDAELAREVAVKLLHPGLANHAQFFRRFRVEARAAAALNHPNVVQVYDWGEDGGEPFLVLEYLAGGSLRDLLDRGVNLGPPEVAQIGAQAARGLEYAHRRGLVHRDIKPANLLFDEEGVVHVADFGLVRAYAEAAWTEPTGAILGTARYASPEQAQGASVDDRSDVYSLALVCYEALVGRAPFSADTTIATLMSRVNRPLPPSAALGPLSPILASATIGEPLARPDAAAFASDLELLSTTLPRPEPIPIEPRVGRTAGDRPAETPPLRQVDDTEITHVENVQESASPSRSDHRGRRRVLRRVAIVIALLLILGGGAAAATRFVLYGHTVPKLIGLSTTAAERSVRSAGVTLRPSAHVYSPSIPTGDIAAQSPKPGSNVRGGATVKVVLSKGHIPVAVPSVVGRTTRAATLVLHADKFGVRVRPVFNETVTEGTVIKTTPASGSAPYGSTVVVQASRGPRPRTIPNLVGLTYLQAKSALTAERLVPRESLAYSNDVTIGAVISSQPASGATGIAVGSSVTVVVSRGPLLVSIPNVSGQSITAAVSALQGEGLVVTEQIGPPFATTATTTDPAPGTEVKPGSNVTLYVA